MQQRKVPMRKCMGCFEMYPKKELVRIVKTRTNDDSDETPIYEVGLDLTGKKAGRGAYICKNAECLKKARKAKRIQKAFQMQISDEIFEKMEQELKDE